mmetsp:Transcript_18324/g.53563  ORF Transcript_18324/g.53563 Transcript_18324/m.53563 type:complete len:218 (-) Transcript_18324:181-834(-)
MADDSFDVEGGLGPHDGLAPPPPPLEFATRDGNDRNPWSALFCCCFRRVGNLVVLFQLPAKPGETPRLLCVVGPYWPMMMCITTPLILAPCVGVVIYAWPFVHYGVIIGFCCFAAFTLTALWCTACSNPGLVPRYEERPPHADSNWSWNDQTRTFRPRTARYVDDCGVLVDRYDHTCPWTGTAIGGGNIKYFYLFTGSIVPLVFAVVIVFIVALSMN